MNSAKDRYADAFLPFDQLSMPVVATLGNHDHMGSSTAINTLFSQTNIIPLRNQSKVLNNLQIVGIDDKSYRSGKSLQEILQASNIQEDNKFTILISHQPQDLNKVTNFPIDLELAGHTHRGQFVPLSRIIKAFNDYTYGLHTLGERYAFTSQGIGSRGAPIRIGTRSEIVHITLHPIDTHK